MRMLLRRAMRLWRVRVGLGLVVGVVLIGVLGPWIAPWGQTDFVGPPNSVDVADAIFGTDSLGQDVWSRFLLGGRFILLSAAIAAACGVAVGAVIGIAAASIGGWADEALMRGGDVLLGIPPILLALVAMTTIGPEPWLVIAAVAVVTVPRVARVSYGAAVDVVQQEFVETAESLGESRWRIVTSEIVPNIGGLLLVETAIRFTYAIAMVASLAFLGFTTSTNVANWGLMVEENRAAFGVQPWGVLLPAVAIIAITLGTGLIADGIARVNDGPPADWSARP